MTASWTFRTGWPTTPISLDIRPGPAGEPEIVPIVGALNSDRLPANHRLDLRLAREWVFRQGTAGLSLTRATSITGEMWRDAI